jgi:hypothetical protein
MLAGERIHQVNNWWPVMESLLPKAKGRAAEQESDKHKSEVAEIADGFIEYLKMRQQEKGSGAS